MTTPSAFANAGLSINVRAPLVQGGESIGNYTGLINSYNHTITASEGFASASFTVTGDISFMEDWLENGLGRHIVVYGPSAEIVWEGFVNQIEISMGGVSYVRGPLTEMGNRVMTIYTPIIDWDASGEPITGTAIPTVILEDKDSQARYGIWEKIITIGTATTEQANYANSLFLMENAHPEGFPTIDIGNSGDVSITVQCRGYVDWLNYIYNYGLEGETPTHIFASDKILAILAEDPNDIISTQYNMIDFNGSIVYDMELDNKSAKTIIDDTLTQGGGNDDRWIFGIYANRQAVFKAIPTSVEYIYYKTDKNQYIETVGGSNVNPCDVLPGSWVAIPDVLSSPEIKVGYPREDPRVFFAEEITYTAPDQLSMSGLKVGKLSQYLARLGLENA